MVYVHTGNLVSGRNIPLILRTFERLPSESPAHVVFVGEGPLKDSVLQSSARSHRVHWMAPVSPGSVVDLVRQADVAFALMELTSDSYRYSSPNKLWEALMASVPPVCTDLVEARKVLGPEADRWILAAPEAGLGTFVERTDRDDVRRFRESVPALGSWDEEVAPLLERLGTAIRDRTGRHLIKARGR
jgi:glycosyltransferase involved in cell wall biosynthesis